MWNRNFGRGAIYKILGHTLLENAAAGEIEPDKNLISDRLLFLTWGAAYFRWIFKMLRTSSIHRQLWWQKGGLVLCVVWPEWLCLNNKNGTHGEFRWNWLSWLWAGGGRPRRPLATSQREREVEPYGRPTPATSLLYRTRNIPEVEEEAETRSAGFFSPRV